MSQILRARSALGAGVRAFASHQYCPGSDPGSWLRTNRPGGGGGGEGVGDRVKKRG